MGFATVDALYNAITVELKYYHPRRNEKSLMRFAIKTLVILADIKNEKRYH
jgi:hypothetical protein